MKTTWLFTLFVLLASISVFGQTAKIDPDKLRILEGSEWIGTLTYLDYSSNKRTSIKSNLKVSGLASNYRGWKFDYIYPEEPKANSSAFVRLSNDGAMVNGQKVVEFSKEKDYSRLVTESEGPDNGKKAIFRFTYLFSPKSFSITKEVKAEGSDEFFERNTYNWTR